MVQPCMQTHAGNKINAYGLINCFRYYVHTLHFIFPRVVVHVPPDYRRIAPRLYSPFLYSRSIKGYIIPNKCVIIIADTTYSGHSWWCIANDREQAAATNSVTDQVRTFRAEATCNNIQNSEIDDVSNYVIKGPRGGVRAVTIRLSSSERIV